MDVINHDTATYHLKELLDKKKALQTEELVEAVMKSKHCMMKSFAMQNQILKRNKITAAVIILCDAGGV